MEWSEVSSRIAEARMQRGLTQTQLSQAVGIERSALTKIEAGQRKVSALELAAIAAELGRRLEWFVLPRPASVVQHRGATTPEWMSSDIDVALEQALADTGLLVELGHLSPPGRPTPLARPESMREAEALGCTARTLCGLDTDSPVVDLVGAAFTAGLVAFAEPIEGGADAATAGNGTWGVALINSTNQVGRRRLALTHELGHHLLDDGFVEDYRIDAPGQSQHEARIDRMARAFLLPEAPIRQRWTESASHGIRHVSVLLASIFRVDMSTLARRLHTDLGLIAADAADQIRRIHTNQADIVENDLYVPHDLEDVSLHPEYAKAALRAYRADDLSKSRTMSLLRNTFGPDDLPTQPTLDEGALWSLTQ
ncbi:MAG TPA: XRE family transcriptional regulator [Arachnia sp.]|nr:XRE family transcriptional regulator [Arachnia sp.]HMT86254.1 XRE family transcriptional regulator [Arachnia sp.]